jgi:flavodoxin-like protein
MAAGPVTFDPAGARAGRSTMEVKQTRGVTVMRAVIIYESMYGNTHLVADAIGAGLGSAFDVSVVPVARVSPAVLADADLVVVGGPTHVHGMSRAGTRKAAVEAANKPASPLRVEPDAPGPGLRDWFGALGQHSAKAAAFDTRIHGPAALTGRASKGLTRQLRAHGFDVIAQPESFLVTKQDRLEPEETDRARAWGTKLAESIVPSRIA